MSRFQFGAVVWGTWLALFAIAELTAAFGIVPWPTLSSWVKEIEGKWVWGCFFILIGLTILNIHLVAHFLPRLYREISG